ncbi:3309_t:CDS:1 [Scutellospora calospora]|uniref:3309_t:CDS:1 n=1 Tax=Scutellospora calospora TaxID=85575 RepID=A0ACA9NBZ4_9GLOM|nr:3309_t:CDS:1 [Scutellospora calospora]
MTEKTLQEWLDENYLNNEKDVKILMGYFSHITPDCHYDSLSKEDKESYGSPSLWTCPPSITKGGELDLREYVCLKRIWIDKMCLSTPFTKLVLGCLLQLTHLELRESNLDCLDVSECPNLIELIFCKNKSALKIKVNKFAPIKKLLLNYTTLKDLEFLENINKKNVTCSSFSYSKFSQQDLSCLAEFVNLEILFLYQSTFYGDLKPLAFMNRLEFLSISFTDIDGGLEYLPDGINRLCCDGDTKSKVKNIEESLKK